MSQNFKHQFIRAGAGAGKTSRLIAEIINSITGYFEAHRTFPSVAVSTFTRKATRELKERLVIKAMDLKNPALIQYICYSPRLRISTLHGLFYHFIQTYAIPIGFSPKLSVIDETESHTLFISFLKEVLLQQKQGVKLLEHYSFKEISHMAKQYVFPDIWYAESVPVSRLEMESLIQQKKQKIIEALKVKKSRQKEKELLNLENELDLLDVFYELCEALQLLGKGLLTLSQQKKRELNKISINDLEIMVWDILNMKELNLADDPAFLFLDEYQDTSFMQKKILDRLSQGSRTFIVGDPGQSIYYFRGADVRVFVEKEKEIAKHLEGQVQSLTQNYRSHPELVFFFNSFFAEKKYQKMSAVRDNTTLSHPAVQFKLSKTSGEEWEFLETVKCIKELIQQGTLPEDIAVLARQNKALRGLAQYIKASHIPFHLHSSGGFTHRREVRDSLFLWKFLLNPHDDENLISLLRTPYARLPDQTIANGVAKARQRSSRISLWHFLIQTGFKSILSEMEREMVLALLRGIKKSQEVGLQEGFQLMLFSLGFMDTSYYQDPTGVGSANLWKLIYSLKKHEGRDSLFSFSENVFCGGGAIEGEEGPSAQNALSAVASSGVSLMTIHSAKGLEFKHVILIKVCAGFRGGGSFSYFTRDRDTGRFALSVRSEKEDKRTESLFHKKVKEKEREQELLEFDRLLYVAMTRAQESLTLIGAGKPEKDSWPQRFSAFSHS